MTRRCAAPLQYAGTGTEDPPGAWGTRQPPRYRRTPRPSRRTPSGQSLRHQSQCDSHPGGLPEAGEPRWTGGIPPGACPEFPAPAHRPSGKSPRQRPGFRWGYSPPAAAPRSRGSRRDRSGIRRRTRAGTSPSAPHTGSPPGQRPRCHGSGSAKP